MPTLRFTGQILPRCFPINLEAYPIVNMWDAVNSTDLGTMKLSISDSEFTIQVDMFTALTDERTGEAMRSAHDLVEDLLSLLSFQTGRALSLVIEKIHYEDGTIHEVGIEDQSLPKFATALQSDEDFTKVVWMVNNDRNDRSLSLALRDLAASIDTVYAAPINCARVIETIRNYFIPPGQRRKHGWAPMREALNISQQFLERITDAARGPRHGDWPRAPHFFPPLREMAWQVMNRFLEYRKRGNQLLPDSEFPLLD
jgi:hypothetical protein